MQTLEMVVVVAQPGLVHLGLVIFGESLEDRLHLLVGTHTGLVGNKGDLLESPLREEGFGVADEEDALALGVGAGCAAETVDVALLFRGDADLEDGRYAGEVHASGDDVGGTENSRGGFAVFVCDSGALALGEAAVEGRHRGQAWDHGEDVAVQTGCGGCGSKDDGFEGAAAGLLELSGGFFKNGANHGGCDGRERGHLDEELGHAFVRVGFAFGNGGYELVAGGEHETGYLVDVLRNGGGEQHALSVGLLLGGELADDFSERGHEAHVQESVCFVEHKSIQLSKGIQDVFVRHVIDQSTRRGDEYIAPRQDELLLLVLVGAANGSAHAVLGHSLE